MNLDSYDLFQYRDTLKEISKDTSERDHPVYMTESETRAVNFDKVKEHYLLSLKRKTQEMESLDGLKKQSDGSLVFIEFKNGSDKSAIKKSLQGKVPDSLLVFCDIVSTTISYTRDNVDMIVVYNKSKISSCGKNAMRKLVAEKSNKPLVYFGAAKYQGLFFRKVSTYSMEEFEDYLNRQENDANCMSGGNNGQTEDAHA